MASGAVPQLRRLALLALAVLSCLQAVLPAASQLSSQPRRPFPPRPLIIDASTATTPLVVEETEAAAAAAGGHAAAAAALRRACTYTVKVKTSCASPARSSDAVSLAFGDAYRNEVYVAQLAPGPGFERCATDTFRVSGPCGYGVCYLYLRRAGGGGRVGWAPEWVRVYEPTSATPSTFYYGGGSLPDGVWYGFDRCPHRATAAAADDADTSSVDTAQSM